MGGLLVLNKANKTSNMNNTEVRNMKHILIPYNMHLSLKSWQITLQLQLAQTNQNILISKIRPKKNCSTPFKNKSNRQNNYIP